MSFMDPETTAAGFGVQPGMRVADFGAGGGYFTILMAKMVGETGRVTAVDVLDAALDEIQTKVRAEGLTNVTTVRSNLEVVGSSGLADGSQDLVLVKNMLFQSPEKGAVIGEAARVLKSGGGLIIIDWKKGAGGLGPPDDLRINATEIEQIAASAGLTLGGNLDPDTFHFGRRFTKNG